MEDDSVSATSEPRRRAPLPDVLLLFVAAVGSTISAISILSQLQFYTKLFGDNFYTYLNLVVFLPLLPISVLQAVYDAYFDVLYTSQISFAFRGHVGYLLSIICLLGIPYSNSQYVLLSVVFLLGTASSILQGSLRQLASSLYNSDGRLSAAVTAGMQASAVAVLCIELYTSNVGTFYRWTNFVVGASWASFGLFLSHQKHLGNRLEILQQPLLRQSDYDAGSSGSLEDSDEMHPDIIDDNYIGNANSVQQLSYVEVWKSSWKVCAVMFITIGSSLTVASWFNRFGGHLPQILFYLRVFGDLLGRLATLIGEPSLTFTTILATSRLLFVPYFFPVAFGVFQTRETILAVGVFVFALSSGYIATVCYQLAPKLLPRNEISSQTKLLNVCFSVSVVVGLISSLILSKLTES